MNDFDKEGRQPGMSAELQALLESPQSPTCGIPHTTRRPATFTNRTRGNTVSTIRFQKHSLAVTRCLPYLTPPRPILSESRWGS
jgi:hypothetical protein